MNVPDRTDIVIAGAGMAGLALAVALKDAFEQHIDVVVCDPSLGKRPVTNRTSAIAAGSRRMLETLGVWPSIESRAQPIQRMIITDSNSNDVVRPAFLNFEAPEPDGPYAHMVFNGELEAALEARALGLGVQIIATQVTGFETTPDLVSAQTPLGHMNAQLLVAADGLKSRLRDMAGIRSVDWSYPLAGIVATIGHERPHEGVAYEHFLPEGPFAILPLSGNRSSIVWTTELEQASEIIALPEDKFCNEVEKRFGLQFGALKILDAPGMWPLSFHIARRFASNRVALIGDAAHVIHPLAGQGINLGFRDVAALSEAIAENIRLGLDAGSPRVTGAYESARRFDAISMAAGMDTMNRLFTNSSTILRVVRDIGMGLVDRLPELKWQLIREASGLAGAVPRLMRGELL